MNLIVIPLTERLLTDENSFSYKIINYAVDKHIPVLPIMKEPGLDPLFQSKFQNMQYLYDNPADTTAIPYREKLAGFLDSVFWGSELSNKIRAAFHAYIFMSYRKKDRQLAQELMRLIHEKEEYRDIAIWYDEFLIPGEDFSQSIKHALESSDLFTLVVTPNLVNEENYIRTTEYPLAVDMKKPVLPVEMLATDVGEMEKSFEGIANISNKNDAEEIYQRIQNLIPGIIERENAKDPLHDFFMGLAYLSGIEVEIERDRGVSLIIKAAESGFDEAMEKLVSMYFWGDGVSRDYDEAIKWQEKIVEKYRDIAEKTMAEEDTIIFIRHLDKLCSISYDAENLNKALENYEWLYEAGKVMVFGTLGKNIFQKAHNFIKKYAGRSEYYTESLYELIKAARMLMVISVDLGFYELQQKWTKKAVALANAGQMSRDDERIVDEYRKIIGKIGELCIESGNVDGAEEWYRREKETFGDEDYESNDYKMKASIALYNKHMCDLETEKGNYTEAAENIKVSYEIWSGLFAEHNDINLLLYMVNSLISAAKIYVIEGYNPDGMHVLSIIKEKVNESGYRDSGALTKSLACADIIIGDYYMREGKFDEACSLYTHSAAVLTSGSDDFMAAEDLRNAFHACSRLGDYYSVTEDHICATNWYQRGHQYIQDVVVFSRTVNDARLYLKSLEHMYQNCIKRSNLARASEWIDKAQATADGIARSTGISRDLKAKEHTESLRTEFLKIQHAGSPDKGMDNASDHLTLLVYVRENSKTLSLKNKEDIENDVESRIGSIALQFEKTHPLFKEKEKVGDLGRLLTKNKYAIAGLSEKQIDEKKFVLTGRVADILLKQIETLKYDEMAMLLVSYCGFYNLKRAKHVIGGKDKALNDFYRFYRNRIFWKYDVEEIEYRDLWLYLTLMINIDL